VDPANLTHLGQSGFRIATGDAIVYIDPYLSDFVERAEGPAMRRMRPAPMAPDAIRDADWVLVSHRHADHCDPDTLGPIAANCPRSRFLAPFEVVDFLRDGLGIPADRLFLAEESWQPLSPGARVLPVPAAHRAIERNAAGQLRCVGFLLEAGGQRVYHSGDCSVDPEIVARLAAFGGIDVALLPVNECNYYRERAGIIGNMSVRDAFGFAGEIAARTVVPMHYDMFAPNCVHEEEILVVYRHLAPAFRLVLPGDCHGPSACS
jgi:L-ascorbate metabolism protein UlaG (beta-lactamase superfamily)